jgi:hypothetical protein
MVIATTAIFPDDIERAIHEALLNDTKDMCYTMSLVASRFYAWWVRKLLPPGLNKTPDEQDQTDYFPYCYHPPAQQLDEANE